MKISGAKGRQTKRIDAKDCESITVINLLMALKNCFQLISNKLLGAALERNYCLEDDWGYHPGVVFRTRLTMRSC